MLQIKRFKWPEFVNTKQTFPENVTTMLEQLTPLSKTLMWNAFVNAANIFDPRH